MNIGLFSDSALEEIQEVKQRMMKDWRKSDSAIDGKSANAWAVTVTMHAQVLQALVAAYGKIRIENEATS